MSVLLAVCGSVPVYAQPSALETKLKAAFVSKFPQFVVWAPAVSRPRVPR